MRKYRPPAPGTPEWKKLLTASKVPTLVKDPETGKYANIGYDSVFELWNQIKFGLEKEITPRQELMFRNGHIAEATAREWLTRTRPLWEIERGGLAHHDPSLPFPNLATLDFVARHSITGGRRIFEVKAPTEKRFKPRDNWVAQVQFQMHITGIHEATILVVQPLRTVHEEWVTEFPVEYNQEFCESLVESCTEFWETLKEEVCPFPETTRPKFEPGPVVQQEVEISDELGQGYETAVRNFKQAETELKAVTDQIEQELSNARYGLWGGKLVATRLTGRFSASNVPAEIKEKYTTEVTKISKHFDSAAFKKDAPDQYKLYRGDDTFKFETADFVK